MGVAAISLRRIAIAILAIAMMLTTTVAFPSTAEAQNASEWCFGWALADADSGTHWASRDNGNFIALPIVERQCGTTGTPTCFGWPATIVSNATVVHGTDGFDVIVGGSADQTIYGGGGRDIICGGAGNDRIYGNTGRDLIDGGTGNDRIDGGKKGDAIYGGPGNDYLIGGLGDDEFIGGVGANRIFGGDGDDWLTYVDESANAGDDVVEGGAGTNYYGSLSRSYFAIVDGYLLATGVSPRTTRRW